MRSQEDQEKTRKKRYDTEDQRQASYRGPMPEQATRDQDVVLGNRPEQYRGTCTAGQDHRGSWTMDGLTYGLAIPT